MEPLRDEDGPGAVCYRVTPELYLGYARGASATCGTYMPDKASTYNDPGMHTDGFLYLFEGDSLLASEYLARPAGATRESVLTFRTCRRM